MIRRTMAATAVMAVFSPALYAQADPAPPVQTEAAQRAHETIYAQQLVERTTARHRELVEFDLHMREPRSGDRIIVAAKSAKRIGAKSDADDLDVVKTGTPFVEVNRRADQNVEVHLPLLDMTGKVIGEVEMTFPYPPGSGLDKDALIRAGELIRDEVSQQIPNEAAMFEPARSDAPAPRAAAPAEPATSVVAAQLGQESVGNTGSLPMTKEVMSAGQLQGAQDGVTDAVKNQAGVSPTNSSGSPADSAQIRGIKVNLFANYRLNGGLPTANVMSVPSEDKARVETLKGANALMFGVASPAGIINMVTKRAPEHDVASLAVLGNSFGQIGAAADVSHRFGSEKRFGIRVNASDTHLENGVRGASGRGWFGSVGADWSPTDRLHFQFDLEEYSKQVVEQGSISLPTAINGHVAVPRPPDPRNLLSGPWAVFNAKTTNVQGRVDYDIAPGWKVLAEIGQSDGDRSRLTTRIGGYNVFTGAGGVPTVSEVTQVYFNKYKRAELQGQFNTGPLGHDVTLGVSRSERIAETPAQNSIVIPVKVNIFDPIAIPAPVPTHPNTSLPVQVDADTGLYAYDSVALGSRWKVLLGFRESRSSARDGDSSSAVWVPSPAAGILYDVLPATTLFASYMKGLEDGGVAPANAANAYHILPPAVSTQYEVGVRENYFKWLQVTASVFDISRANAVTDPITNIFANDGTIEYKGFEAVVTQDISRQWSLSEAFEYLHAVQDPTKDMLIKGFIPENTPKWIGNVAVTHRPSWLPGLSLTMRASFISKRPVNPQDQGYIPGYTIYSLGVGYVTRIAGKRVDLKAAVDNVFNKRYWNSVQTGTLGIGMDRSIKFIAKMDF